MISQRLNHSEHLEYSKPGMPPCTDKRERLYLKEVPAGTVWFCHDCGYGGIKRNTNLTPAEVLRRVNQSVIPSVSGSYKQIKLPYDFDSKIPLEGKRWLYKYGITDEEIARYNFGYSGTNDRLILPVFEDEALVYYQARNLGAITKSNPKYLNIRQSGAKNVFFKNYTQPDHKAVVIVEDILSAVKVGRVTNAVSLLGSYIPDSFHSDVNDFEEYIIWLDRDKIKSSLKYLLKLQSRFNKKVRIIMQDKDPKEYSVEKIKEILNEI